MPTNINEAVWTSGPVNHTGGGNDALILVPHDIDIVDISIEVAAATTAQVEVTHDSREDIVGITERPLRYAQVAVNDLGASGELRMNAAAGQDFTDDGWAIGDTFEIISHRAPDFGPEGTHPTTLGDKQVYTVATVSALVITFATDPAYSLAEGDIVVAQSRAPVAEDDLNWSQVDGDVVGADTAHINVGSAGPAVRVIASAGTGAIDYEFRGRHQSVIRPVSFVQNVESRPFAGYVRDPWTAEGVDDGVVVWDEVVVPGAHGSLRQGRLTQNGATFQTDGISKFDRVFIGGHSETGNNGLYTVDAAEGQEALRFKEPLHGVAGTDSPGRIAMRRVPATLAAPLPNDYLELILGDGANSVFAMQDAANPLLDSGPDELTDMTATTPTPLVATGPWPGVVSRGNNAGWADDYVSATGPDYGMGASQEGTIEYWCRQDSRVGGQSAFSISGGGNFITIQHAATTGTIDAQFAANPLADPGAWSATTLYAQGDRVRAVADDGNVQEAEVGGTSAGTEPTWAIKGATVGDGSNTAGFQDGNYGGALTGGTATGLANDATVYNASVVVDGGGSQTIAVTGSAAQTYTTLITELDADTTGATWALNGGELRCTSSSTGDTSSIATTDGPATNLFSSLTAFVSFNTAVQGLNAITWRHVTSRALFHDIIGSADFDMNGNTAIVDNEWTHLAITRSTLGYHYYVNGVLTDEILIPAADTVPGTFGTPVRLAFSTDYTATSFLIGSQGGTSFNFEGDIAYMATYSTALPAATLLAHYNKGVELGL
jgi:hypothetical protein